MRKSYIDNVRWITVVVVVFYHVIYMYATESVTTGLGRITQLETQYYDVFLYFVYPWIMTVLFLVAGMCSRYYLERHTDREFLRSRTTRLLVPSTAGLFAFQFIQGYINVMLNDGLSDMPGVPVPVKAMIIILSGIGVLWFIQVLWVLSVLLILIRRIEKDRLWELGGRAGVPALILLAIPVWLMAQILNTPIIVVYRFGLYGAVFLIGYFVMSHDEVVERLKKSWLLFLAATLVLGIVFCGRYFGQNYADAPINRSPLFLGYSWSACMAMIGGMAKYGDFSNAFTRWMGKRSFGLYVFHYLGISAVALWIAKPGLLPAPAVYLISLIAGFAVSYVLNAVISRLPFFRWAVLGIKGDKHVQG